jgi:tetratricopeptide (TPR) repeat protein
MSGIRGVATVLVCCVILAATAPAAAASDPAQGRADFDQGRRQFQAGDYREALASFKKGFLVTEDASFLLNIAQCHRFLGETAEALMMYRLYLKSARAGGNPEAQAVATKAIRELEGEAAAPAAPPAVTPAAPEAQNATVPVAALAAPATIPPGRTITVSGRNRPPSASAYPVLETLPEGDIQRTPAASPNPSTNPATARHLRQAGTACASAGLISVGLGVYYWTRATSLSKSVNNATAYNQADYDQGKRAETMQWIFYSVGAVAVVTGATLVLYGSRSPSAKKSNVSLAPVVGPGAAGLLAHGAF